MRLLDTVFTAMGGAGVSALKRVRLLLVFGAVAAVFVAGGLVVSCIRSDARDEAVAEIAVDTTRTITEIERSHDAIAKKSAADGDAAVDDSLRSGSFLLKPDAEGSGGTAVAD